MSKITYANKVAINENAEISDINKVTDNDMNEIKTVVNNNDDELITINTNLTNATTYSTDEIRIGTWIDGKPIYRKVVQINGLPNNTETTYQTGIINGETIKYDGFLSLSESDSGLQHMPYLSPYSSTGNVYYWVRKDATYIHIKTGADRSSSSAYIIIEYTKTTD